MFQAIRINNLRATKLLRISSTSSSISNSYTVPKTAVRFAQAAARDSIEPGSSSNKSNNQMENQAKKKTDPIQKQDLMSHSFGDGYATRSDEEGFGGIYGGNESEDEKDPRKMSREDPLGHYDKTQGSEVKEKEKARHQT